MDCLNVIVMTPHVQAEDEELIFGPFHEEHCRDGCVEGNGIPHCPDAILRTGPGMLSMWRLLVLLGAFPSVSQARKNWKGPASIPSGFSEFTVGKLKRQLVIWNPTE